MKDKKIAIKMTKREAELIDKDVLQDCKGTVRVKVRAIYMDLTGAWTDEQLKWIRSNDNKIVTGHMRKYPREGRKLFKADGINIALRDDEFDIVP